MRRDHVFGVAGCVIVFVLGGWVYASAGAASEPAGESGALNAQVQAVWEAIHRRDPVDAAARMDDLLALDDPAVVKPARDLAWGFSAKLGDYEKALDIYWTLIRTYPDAPEIVWVYGSYAKACLDLERVDEALAVVEPLLEPYYSTFEKHYDALAWIAWEFQQAQVWDQAAVLYARLVALHPTDPRACRARADLAWTYLKAGQPDEAEAVLDQMLVGCGSPEALEGVENCGWLYRRDYSNPDKALDLYERFVTAYPESERAVQLWRCIIETYIETNNRAAAVENLERMQAVFETTPRALWAAATGIVTGIRLDDRALRDAYVERFCRYVDQSEAPAALDYVLEQAMDRLTRLDRWPPTSEACLELVEVYEQVAAAAEASTEAGTRTEPFALEPSTLLGLAWCYQYAGQPDRATVLYNRGAQAAPTLAQEYKKGDLALAGDHYCGAYVVWHLLEQFGRTTPIESIVEAMGIREKGYSTIRDIVDYLATREIDAQPMVVSAERLGGLDRLFIMYLVPQTGSGLGHFVLVSPCGDGQGILLDGAKDPVRIDLGAYSDTERFWDGTILLIQTTQEEALQAGLAQQVAWQTALAVARCWLLDGEGQRRCLNRVEARYHELAEQPLLNLRGGCGYTDCVNNGQSCETNLYCESSADCFPRTVCIDGTRGERCMVVFGWWHWPNCVADPSHPCTGTTALVGSCTGSLCDWAPPTNPYMACGTNVPQCHF